MVWAFEGNPPSCGFSLLETHDFLSPAKLGLAFSHAFILNLLKIIPVSLHLIFRNIGSPRFKKAQA
jgi:hypothetical protein